MLGYESERRLTNLLVAVGDGERDLEVARQRLCSIRDFATHSAFERVDRNCSGTISSIELINFLRDNSVYHVAESEMFNLVCFFDSDGNRRLSFQEFLQMLLPCEDNLLRNMTLDRPSRRVARFEYLPRDIELAMVNVIEKEIDLQRRLEVLKRELQVQYDYSPLAAFRSIDRYNSGLVTTVNTGAFLRQNGHYASEMELLAIIRRIDTDGDASVDYREFAEFMQPLAPVVRVPVVEPVPVVVRPASPLRGSSPLRASSPRRESAPMRSSSPMRVAVASPVRISPSRKPVLPLYQEDELVHSLKEICNLEQEIENAKIQLAHKPDFNIIDAFQIFDVPRYGAVDVHQLQAGLNAIGIYPSFDECDLIITRYDLTGDRRLSISEFEKMFLAHDGYYAAMVSRRGSNFVPRVVRRDDVFLPNTAYEFQSMWRTHIRCENAAEALRQRLASRPGFNAYEAFNSLDLNGDGSITTLELRRMIESRGYFVGQKELDQVIDKMDRDRNGRVTFAEFSDDIRTKSPVRR
jgi:Ca2+-binding EF-hand superfamily protein